MYNELIKSFERIRSYMRDFYVYGFKSRENFDKKSLRSYDNEKRRIESYLGDYMKFAQKPSGEKVFLSIDSRNRGQNPLYKAWKAKSFTDGDITLHFILLDIFQPDCRYTLGELVERIYQDYLECFQEPISFDESTVRKKLKEYAELGLVRMYREGRRVLYGRGDDIDLSPIPMQDAVEFFSETGLCGVIGSYLLDRQEREAYCFSFKHHYITHALDSEVLYRVLEEMGEKREIRFLLATPGEGEKEKVIVPLKIYVSVQNGRQYVMGYDRRRKSFQAYRLDNIGKVEAGEVARDFENLRARLEQRSQYIWGVVCRKQREYVEFTVQLGDGEEHIYRRLMREKRCGSVERVDEHTCRFTAEVYDTWELVPWIRTFLCRITSMKFSNRTVENCFKEDLEKMYEMYGI